MSKSLPILSHMPWNVNQLITSSTDTVTKQSLRFSSNNFEKLDRNLEISYEKLALQIDTDKRTASVILESVPGNTVELKYSSTPNGYTVKNEATKQEKAMKNSSLIHGVIEFVKIFRKTVENEKTNEKRQVEGIPFLQGAIDQFVKLFQNPKTIVNRFEVKFQDFYNDVEYFDEKKREVIERIRTFFASLNRQVAVREFTFNFNGDQKDVLQFLPFFQAGTLRKIYLLNIWRHTVGQRDIDLTKVAETNQWKQATHVFLHLLFNVSLPSEKWFNFVNVYFYAYQLTLSASLIENFFNNPSFEKCEIRYESFDCKPFLENLLRYDPDITGKTGLFVELTLKIDIPNQPEMCFKVWMLQGYLVISKVRKDEEEQELEEGAGEPNKEEYGRRQVKLTAAEVLADIDEFVFSFNN